MSWMKVYKWHTFYWPTLHFEFFISELTIVKRIWWLHYKTRGALEYESDVHVPTGEQMGVRCKILLKEVIQYGIQQKLGLCVCVWGGGCSQKWMGSFSVRKCNVFMSICKFVKIAMKL